MSQHRPERLQKLLPPNAIGTADIMEAEDVEVEKHLQERLPVIYCECGAKILVLPDLQAMNRAIRNHVKLHAQIGQSDKGNADCSSNVTELLCQLALRKISEQNNPLVP